ncbi:MAG: sodium/solute symporter [Phycisphaerales bacterium]
MGSIDGFQLEIMDYLIIAAYFITIWVIGAWAGRRSKEETTSEDYFLAGRKLPWFIVGASFIASNISTEHFIGMIGASFVYGICVSMTEWGNINSFTILIWFFIPFLLATKIFTTPEFLEKRFNRILRQFFAIVTVVSNVVAFLAAVLYGGGLAMSKLFPLAWLPKEYELFFWVAVIGVGAGFWAIYGGLSSVVWMDFFMLIIMIAGGISVTILGLYMLSGDSHSLVEGWRIMIERNQATSGIWKEVVDQNAQYMAHTDTYNRLSVIQPVTHEVIPWPSLLVGFLSVGIWYNVINQFMIQRVLGAKNMYHARMGIVFAGYIKILMPLIVVIPGLILFARYPEVMKLPWKEIRPAADAGYIQMITTLIPVGLKGLFLAALFGAIQSTVNGVLNSTSTVFTLDIYKEIIYKKATDKHLVKVGIWATVVFLCLAIALGAYIGKLGGSLFIYIQSLYAFFAPPFAAIFLLGILFRRINSQGATIAVFLGFALGILMKLYVQYVPGHVKWMEPYLMQAMINWMVCVVLCVSISCATPAPMPEQVTDDLTINWKKINIFSGLGNHWYTSVLLWWGLFAFLVVLLVFLFSGIFV